MKIRCSWAFLLFCLLTFSLGCGDTVVVKEQSVKVEADTFQVGLHIDDAAGLPPLLVFDDESPREATRKGRTENMTTKEVVISRYPPEKYEIVGVERSGRRYWVTIRNKTP